MASSHDCVCGKCGDQWKPRADSAAPAPLAPEDLDELVDKLKLRDVRTVKYEGDLKGHPIKLDLQFERPQRKERSNDE